MDVEKIIGELREENKRLNEELKKLDLEYRLALSKLVELNAVTGKIYDVYTKEDRLGIDTDEIVKKYLEGDTAYKIAKEYGCNIGTIINRLKNRGVYKGKGGNL